MSEERPTAIALLETLQPQVFGEGHGTIGHGESDASKHGKLKAPCTL